MWGFLSGIAAQALIGIATGALSEAAQRESRTTQNRIEAVRSLRRGIGINPGYRADMIEVCCRHVEQAVQQKATCSDWREWDVVLGMMEDLVKIPESEQEALRVRECQSKVRTATSANAKRMGGDIGELCSQVACERLSDREFKQKVASTEQHTLLLNAFLDLVARRSLGSPELESIRQRSHAAERTAKSLLSTLERRQIGIGCFAVSALIPLATMDPPASFVMAVALFAGSLIIPYLCGSIIARGHRHELTKLSESLRSDDLVVS